MTCKLNYIISPHPESSSPCSSAVMWLNIIISVLFLSMAQSIIILILLHCFLPLAIPPPPRPQLKVIHVFNYFTFYTASVQDRDCGKTCNCRGLVSRRRYPILEGEGEWEQLVATLAPVQVWFVERQHCLERRRIHYCTTHPGSASAATTTQSFSEPNKFSSSPPWNG